MSFSIADTQKLYEVFKGSDGVHGETVVGEIVDGKAQSESRLVRDPVTPILWEKHLNGEVSIGISPMRKDGTVLWCAIDIDDYSSDLFFIVDAIEDFNLPLVPCLSKSKKLHIYCFFNEPVEASNAIDLLKQYLIAFRCPAKTEVFPKQNKLNKNTKAYSWINMPYFDANNENNWRKSVKGRGLFRTVGEFLQVVEERRVSYEEHLALLEMTPYYGAPPCIRSGAILRDIGPGQRNQWFYNVACYLRMNDEDIDLEEPLLELNDTMRAPLPASELRQTVCKISNKSYYYQCMGMPGCDKGACKKTTYGIGNTTESTGFTFGQLTKMNGDPVYWTWEINGVELTFHDTNEIMQQEVFRRQCMEKLNQLPYKVKQERWTSILRRALESALTEEVDVMGDFGTGAQLYRGLARFFANGRTRATDISQVYTGKVYEDIETGELVFSAKSLQEYLQDKQRVMVSPGDIRDKVRMLGGKYDGETKFWRLSKDRVPVDTQTEVKVDYHDVEGYEDGDMQF